MYHFPSGDWLGTIVTGFILVAVLLIPLGLFLYWLIVEVIILGAMEAGDSRRHAKYQAKLAELAREWDDTKFHALVKWCKKPDDKTGAYTRAKVRVDVDRYRRAHLEVYR